MSKNSSREFAVLQTKLSNAVYNIESSIEKNKLVLLQNQSNFSKLEETVMQLENELKEAQLETSMDYLTNILNRRSFDIELEKIEKKHNMFNTKYAIVFYDIDFFKKINDTYGHECGDIILKTFSEVLKNLTRKEDILARYGGEEFVVLLNYKDKNEVIKYLKRVKSIIAQRVFIYKDKTIKLKFSAGLAFRDLNDSALETLNKADELLYEAKNTGRDKIILDDGTIV